MVFGALVFMVVGFLLYQGKLRRKSHALLDQAKAQQDRADERERR
jgi:hypothetical protein